jgi:cell filamentation protein
VDHPYCYPGTDVLRNLEDIRDNDELERFERLVSGRRLERLPYNLPVTGLPIAVAGYRKIHRYLFQDIYDWAGEYRTVDTGRTGPFCKAKYIARYMDSRFAAINGENNLRGLSAHQFSARTAEHISELNAIHCFLEGNGRTQRAFLDILAGQAGHAIDLARIDPQAWNAASVKSYHTQDYRPMQRVITGAIENAP